MIFNRAFIKFVFVSSSSNKRSEFLRNKLFGADLFSEITVEIQLLNLPLENAN